MVANEAHDGGGVPGKSTGDAMGKQETRGKEKKLLGQGKEIVGILTGDMVLELEGDRQQAEGAIQEKLGKEHADASGLRHGAARAIGKQG
jgi:uncharacterized protein YjbJ (UPF0337 family)